MRLVFDSCNLLLVFVNVMAQTQDGRSVRFFVEYIFCFQDLYLECQWRIPCHEHIAQHSWFAHFAIAVPFLPS